MAAAAAADTHHRPTVLLTFPPPSFPGLLHSLQQRFTVLCLHHAPDPSSFIALHSSSIVALVGSRAPSHLIHSLPNLRLIATPSVGIDKIDLDCCRERGISIANGQGVASSDVADLAILHMLAVSRRLPAADRHVRQGAWPQKGEFLLTRKEMS